MSEEEKSYLAHYLLVCAFVRYLFLSPHFEVCTNAIKIIQINFSLANKQHHTKKRQFDMRENKTQYLNIFPTAV